MIAVAAMGERVSRAFDRARRGEGPTLLESVTMRMPLLNTRTIAKSLIQSSDEFECTQGVPAEVVGPCA